MEKEKVGLYPLENLRARSSSRSVTDEISSVRQSIASVAAMLARLAFAATIILIPFRWRTVLMARPIPPVYKDYTDFLLNAGDIFLIATLVFWGVSLALAGRRIQWGPLFILVPIEGLSLFGILSAFGSADPALSIYHAARLVLLDVLYLYIVNEVHALGDITLPVAIQVLIQAIVAVGQFLQQHSTGLQWLGEYELDPKWQGVSIVWSGQSLLLRAYGLTDHPNLLGGCLAFALVLIAFAYIQAQPQWRGVVAALFALGALALFLTFSRAAWLGLIGGGAVVLVYLLRTRQIKIMQDGFALAIAAAILVLPFVWQYAGYLGVRLNVSTPSMFTGQNRSIVERDALSGAADTLFANHAVLGVGLGAFPVALHIAQPVFPFDDQPPHIVLLDVAAETGIFGAFFYAALLLAPWLALWFQRRRLGTEAASLAVIVVSGLLLATTLVGFFDYYTWLLAPGRLWQWMAWGLWAATYQVWMGASHV